jgi:hypothetical protein
VLNQIDEAEESGPHGPLLDVLRSLCECYESGAISAAVAMAQVAEALQVSPRPPEATAEFEPTKLSNGFRFYRTNHKGAGWQTLICLDGRKHFKYFADSAHGSAEASRKAAEEFASQNRHLHEELWALRNRFVVRKNSRSGIPGVSRYEGSKNRGPYWFAYWADPKTGRRRSRRFSIAEHGEGGALSMAVQTREKAVEPCRERYKEILKILGLISEEPAIEDGARRDADAQD